MRVEWHRVRAAVERLIWWVAVGLPGLVAATRAAQVSSWRGDFEAVRGVGLVSLGGPASISAWWMQLWSLIPVGPIWHRLALGSAVLLTVCSALMMRLSLNLLEKNVRGAAVNVPLAAMATLATGLGMTMQREATVGGSSLLAVALALGIAVVWSRQGQRWRWSDQVWLGVLVGTLLMESRIVGLAMTLALVVGRVVQGSPWKSKGWWLSPVAAVGASVVAAAPFFVRLYSPGALLRGGLDVRLGGLVNLDTARHSVGALAAWRAELGSLLLLLAGLGLVVGLLRKRLRRAVVPLVVFVLFDLLAPASVIGVLAVDPFTAVRTVAVVTLAVASSLGMQTVVSTLIDMALPMSRAAAVLLVLFDLTLVGVASESSWGVADRSMHRGTVLFDDVALRQLPPRSLVLARSHAVVWRLLAAQIVDGERPDVVVVAYPLLKYRSVAARLLARESGSTLLLRDIAIQGTPGEHAMSRLADRRPLFVQFDPGWNERIAWHLTPSRVWLSLTPQPVGKSERRIAVKKTVEQMEKWVGRLREVQPPDEATEAVFRARYTEQAVAAARAGDAQSTLDMLVGLEKLFPHDLVVRSLRQRLDYAKGQKVDVSGLVR